MRNRIEEVLRGIVGDRERNARFANTLSLLEYIGTRKMLKSQEADATQAALAQRLTALEAELLLRTQDAASAQAELAHGHALRDAKFASDPSVEVISHVNDHELNELSLSKLEPFWFTGAAGTKAEGFLLKPPNFDPAKKYPVKFLMHGGPQTAWGDAWSYRWNWELMASSGYVVVGINLLREGLDLPEVSLVAILDADKEGFLRSEGSLIQMIAWLK